MLMGAMVMGPLAGWVIKQFDKKVEGHIPAGFEMLINNFSIGILGMLLAILGYYVIGPFMTAILTVLTAGVDFLVAHSLLPLVSIFIEPAKVLFLNNAINHGIFSPIGASQAAETGRSIMYMLEANPGPGLGVLLAYCFFCKDDTTRQSAPGAVIIHLLGVVIAGAVSFILSSVILKATSGHTKSLTDAQNEMKEMKAQAKGEIPEPTAVNVGQIRKIVFACDAGMGSSAMGATKFHNRIKAERPDLTVTNSSVDTIPADADVVVCQRVLADRAAKCAPQAQLVTLDNFLADPHLDALYNALTSTTPALDAKAEAAANEEIVSDLRNAAVAPLAAAVTEASKANDSVMKIQAEDIQLGLPSVTKEEAIRAAGALLAKRGYVDDSYADAMVEREKLVSTYMGMGVAIPHGTSQKKGTVKKSGVVLLQYPQGVDFGDEKAYLVFGIAGVGNDHLDLLGNVCEILEDEDALEQLKTTSDMNYVLEHLQ